jgi:O-antigen/teichoic acid export membrane protein
MTGAPGRRRAEGGGELFWTDRRWLKRLGQTSLVSWTSTALAFAATVVVARALGPFEYGGVVLALSTATLIASFLDLTLEDGVAHHGVRMLRDSRIGALGGLIRTSLRLDIAIGAVVAGAMIAAAAPLADLVSGGRLPADLLRLAALSILVSTADGTTGALLTIADRPDLRAWVLAGTNVVRLVGVALVIGTGGGASAVVVVYVTASAVGSASQAALAWWLGWRRWRLLPDAGGERVGLRGLSSFAVHTSLAKSLFSGRELLIPVLLGSLAGPAAVGLFRVALFPVFAAGLLSGPLRILLLAEQNKLHAAERYGQLWSSIRYHTIAAFVVGLPACAVGWFMLEWLLPAMYTSSYEEAVGTSRILLVAALFNLAFSWWKTLPAAIGRPQVSSRIGLASLLVMIALLAALGHLGHEGAAVAYSLETIVVGVPLFLYVRRVLLREGRDRAARTAPVAVRA